MAKEEKFCNDTNGDTYPEGGRYWVNCNHGYCQCTARSQEPYSSKNSQKYCHLNQHSFATCARGTYYINMSSVVEFLKWWVLKSKIFGQESTYSREFFFKKSVDELWFFKKCQNCTFKVNFQCQKSTEFSQKKLRLRPNILAKRLGGRSLSRLMKNFGLGLLTD